MDANDITPAYRVWDGAAASEAVELPGLVGWIKAGRVRAHQWIYLNHERRWAPASEITELKMFFKTAAASPGASVSLPSEAPKTSVLRRIRILADLSEEQLIIFVNYMQALPFKQYQLVVRKDEHSDAMYLILEGEVRVRVMIGGRESTLATLTEGEFFGEVALLDHGPRSADVVANRDSVLLKVSAEAFSRLLKEAPPVAAPFLFGLSKSVVGRLRNINKRYEDSIHFQRTAGAM